MVGDGEVEGYGHEGVHGCQGGQDELILRDEATARNSASDAPSEEEREEGKRQAQGDVQGDIQEKERGDIQAQGDNGGTDARGDERHL